MAHPSKVKGNTFERFVVNKAKEYGIEAKRAYASNGESLGLHAEVDVYFPVLDMKAQLKRYKRIGNNVKPNKNVDVQIIKQDRDEAYIVFRLEDWLKHISGKANNNVGS